MFLHLYNLDYFANLIITIIPLANLYLFTGDIKMDTQSIGRSEG